MSKQPFPLPAKFTLHLSAKHPTIYDDVDDPEDSGHPDLSRMCFRVSVECNGKLKILESPSFDMIEIRPFTAFHALRDMIGHILADSVLHDDRCPRFERTENGFVRLAEAQPPLPSVPLPLNIEKPEDGNDDS